MLIKDIKANTGFDVIEGEVTDLADVRTFSKFGRQGRVCNGIIKDESGEIKLTLWNEQIDQVSKGDVIKLLDGYATEWQGKAQVSTGRNGTLEIVKKGDGASAPKEEEEEEAPAEDLEIEEEDI